MQCPLSVCLELAFDILLEERKNKFLWAFSAKD